MTQQQLQSLYVEIPGVSMPVLPEVALLGKTRFEIQAYGQDPSNDVVIIDNSMLINKIAYEVKKARPSYSSLMNYGMNQKLLEENKVTEENIRKAFSKLDGDIWERYSIWAEFMDSLPEKRGHKLPEGKNVALYRGVKVSGENVDTSDVKPLFLKLPREAGTITEEWRIALGTSSDAYHYPADLDYSKKHLDALNVLLWDFRVSPLLYSDGGPWGVPDGGVLLGSKRSADEIVKNLKPAMLKYQLQLKALEKDLDDSKKLFDELGSRIRRIDERIADLKKIKPE